MFQPRRYQVTGIQPVSVDGPIRVPGEVFDADLDPVQEQRLLSSGALRRLSTPVGEFPPPLDVEPPNPEQQTSGRAVLHERGVSNG